MQHQEEKYYPAKRMKSILLKEKEARMDSEQEPLSYGMIAEQPVYREYMKRNPGMELCRTRS